MHSATPRKISERPRELRQSTAAESIVEALVAQGLTTYFGIPGGPIIPLFDAIFRHPGAELIEPRHETAAVFEAMGFHRATGRVPVVVTTAGPGLTNLVTGVVAAHLEQTPMVIVCGDVAWASTGRRLLQDCGEAAIGAERMLSHVMRATVRVSRAHSAVPQALAALQAATSPDRPGPALVVLPIDHAGHRVAATRVVRVAPRAESAPPPPEVLALVESRLRHASLPLLVVGAGARPFAKELRALIEHLRIPFMTTPRAKGLLPETHTLSLRTSGMAASWWARRYTKLGPDAALVLGTDLDDVSTAGTPPIGAGGFLAHVDRDAQVFGRNFPTELALECDVGAFVRAMTEHLRARPISAPGAVLSEVRSRSAFDAPGFDEDDAVPIAPHRVIADLAAAAPPGTRFVTDIGEHMLFALHYLTVERPEDFTIHLGLGSMGSGIGSAIGQAIGDRSTPVVCIAGDGGMQMVGMEVLVAVERRLPVVFAIFNDARYNMVFHGYRQTFEREAAFATPVIDFAGWARSIGARGVHVERPGEIDARLFHGLSAKGPVVLDIRQNASIRIEGEGRVEAIRQMSLLHGELR